MQRWSWAFDRCTASSEIEYRWFVPPLRAHATTHRRYCSETREGIDREATEIISVRSIFDSSGREIDITLVRCTVPLLLAAWLIKHANNYDDLLIWRASLPPRRVAGYLNRKFDWFLTLIPVRDRAGNMLAILSARAKIDPRWSELDRVSKDRNYGRSCFTVISTRSLESYTLVKLCALIFNRRTSKQLLSANLWFSAVRLL